MRRVWALALCVALQAAGLTGLSVHAHPDGHPTDHHRGRAVHVHWGGHDGSRLPLEGPGIAADDHDRAVYVNLFTADAASAGPAPSLACARCDLPVPAERRRHRRIEVVRSHDPPAGRSVPSRAPPAFLS